MSFNNRKNRRQAYPRLRIAETDSPRCTKTVTAASGTLDSRADRSCSLNGPIFTGFLPSHVVGSDSATFMGSRAPFVKNSSKLRIQTSAVL